MHLLPPLPGWDGLHPLVVHFPVALLLVAPLFIVAGLFLRKARGVLFAVAFVLMALGTIAAVVAVETGEATAQLADRTPEINEVLGSHSDRAETTRNAFIVFSAVWLAWLIVLWKVPAAGAPKVARLGTVLFLVAYAGGTLLVANTAHQGGRLVHEFGVRAEIGP